MTSFALAVVVATKLLLLLSQAAGSAIPPPAQRPLLTPTVNSLPLLIGSQPTFLRGLNADSQSSSNVNSSTLNQQIDHFNDSDNSKFSHRYFSNDQYVNGTQVHFLYVEGGQEADPTKISDPTMPIVALASKVGAKLWLLEHRFYGQSRPFT